MFDSGKYWEQRYKEGGDSGSGSYGRLAEFKARILNDLVEELEIKSIIEWGCGDGNNCSMYKVEKYIGMDVSETAIALCRDRFQNQTSAQKRFYCLNEIDFNKDVELTRGYDLAISFDVIYHLIEDDVYRKYMNNLFGSSDRYVLIYSYDGEIPTTAEHVKYRKFSDFVSENYSMFRLIRTIQNDYSRVGVKDADPDNTSWCDFYLFAKE